MCLYTEILGWIESQKSAKKTFNLKKHAQIANPIDINSIQSVLSFLPEPQRSQAIQKIQNAGFDADTFNTLVTVIERTVESEMMDGGEINANDFMNKLNKAITALVGYSKETVNVEPPAQQPQNQQYQQSQQTQPQTQDTAPQQTGDNEATKELTYEQKSEKYKDLPLRVRTRGRAGKGYKVVDTLTEFTTQTKTLLEKNPDLLKITGDPDMDDAQQEAIMIALGPFEEVAVTENEPNGFRHDFKDGRILFFMNNKKHLEYFAEKLRRSTGQNLDEELQQNTDSALKPDGRKGHKPLEKSNDVYRYLKQTYAPQLYELLDELININDPDVVNWVKKVAAKRFFQIQQSKKKDKSLEFQMDDGDAIERSDIKGSAGDFSREDDATKEITARTYRGAFRETLTQVGEVSSEVMDYLQSQKLYSKADLLDAIMKTSLEQLDNVLRPENQQLTKSLQQAGVLRYKFQNNSLVIPADAETDFNQLIDQDKFFNILSDKGQKMISLKPQIDKLAKKTVDGQVLNAGEIAASLNVSEEFVAATANQSVDQIKRDYFIPSVEEVAQAQKEEGELWIEMINFVSQNPQYDPNNNTDATILPALRKEFLQGLNPLITIQVSDIVRVLGGVSNPDIAQQRIAEAKMFMIERQNDKINKKYYSNATRKTKSRNKDWLGVNFHNIADKLVSLAEQKAAEGQDMSAMQVFVDLLRVHTRFKAPKPNKADMWATRHTPSYYKAVGRPVPDEYRSVLNQMGVKASAAERMVYSQVVSAIKILSKLSNLTQGMKKVATSDNTVRETIKMVADYYRKRLG